MRKFILSSLLFIVICICTFDLSNVSAETYGIYTYTVSTYNGATITDCDASASGEIIIPETIGGYPVTSVSDWAFYDCESIRSITIPDSVTSIGNYTFCWCSSLESVRIPNRVTSIGDFAFYRCSSLESITIPDSVTSIGEEAFGVCSNLAYVYYDGTEAEWNAISINSNNDTLTDATIRYNPVAYFTYMVSDGSVKITDCDTSIMGDVIIPLTINGYPVTSIGNNAFYNCSSLESITIPDSVTSIGNNAFYRCSSLESITIPDSVTSIGEEAFGVCDSLESITIPDSVTSIGNYTFCWCSSLESVTIGDSVTSIGEEAFYNCSSLVSVRIPNRVTSIGERAFYDCSSLESVTIGDSVTSIGNNAFYDCSSLVSVTIPDSVASIGAWAFCNCDSLKSIAIPNSVASIGSAAFYDCSSLESVTIGDSVTSIGNATFCDCSSLKSITIPDSVTSIGENAFSGCRSLKNVYYRGSTNDWKLITIGSYNTRLKDATKVYNAVWVNIKDETGVDLSRGYVDSTRFSFADYDRVGYTTHYYTDAELKNEYVMGVAATEDITLYRVHVINQYTYKFVDESGNVLKEATVDYGTIIETPEVPSKESTAQYTCSFAGWEGYTDGMIITDDVIFKAKYDIAVNKYTYTFLDVDGAVLKEKTVDYGTIVEPPIEPAKPSTAQHSYAFIGWEGYTEGMTIEEDVTFTATYKEIVNQYTYKFVDEDGSVSKEVTVDYGTIIEAPEEPSKESTAQYTYTFAGWDGYTDGMVVTSDATFTAKYEAMINKYTYTFLDVDDTILKEETVDYGTVITPPDMPTCDEPYTFDCWVGFEAGMTVTEDVTFVAQKKYKDYTITVDGIYIDGESIEGEDVTVTYGSDYTLPFVDYASYNFLGYYTDVDGSGVKVTDESGNSLEPYSIIGDTIFYPYYEHIYLDEILFFGDETATVGQEGISEAVCFVTKAEATKLYFEVEYPEALSFVEAIVVDFESVTEESIKTENGTTTLILTAQYANDENIPTNSMVCPFELVFNVSNDCELGDVEISISNGTSVIGTGNYGFMTLGKQKITIEPKLAESIYLTGEYEINKPTQYKAEVYPYYTTDKSITWSVTDEKIATVDEYGVVTPIKTGRVGVKATTSDGSNLYSIMYIDVVKTDAPISVMATSSFVYVAINREVLPEFENAVVMVATYDSEGCLESVWSKDVKVDDIVVRIDISTLCPKNSKIMLWNSSNSIEPFCEPVEITISE